MQQNSTITRTDAGSTGVWALGGTLISQESTIVGQDDGLRVRTDKLPSEPVPTFIESDITLTDGTSVSGVTSSGVFVERGADATIRVLNGSTVKGGNGTLLEVVGNSTVDFSATQTALGEHPGRGTQHSRCCADGRRQPYWRHAGRSQRNCRRRQLETNRIFDRGHACH